MSNNGNEFTQTSDEIYDIRDLRRRYTQLKMLSEGSQAMVYLLKDKETNSLCALKLFREGKKK